MHDKPLPLLTPGFVSGIVHNPGFKLSVIISLIPGLRSRNFLNSWKSRDSTYEVVSFTAISILSVIILICSGMMCRNLFSPIISLSISNFLGSVFFSTIRKS